MKLPESNMLARPRFGGGGFKQIVRRGFDLLKRRGLWTVATRLWDVLRDRLGLRSYQRWVTLYDTLNDERRRRLLDDVSQMPFCPTFILVMPFCDGLADVEATVRSVESQIYGYWTLYICIDEASPVEVRESARTMASNGSRIRVLAFDGEPKWATKASRVNATADGDFIVPLDPGDVLSEDAIYRLACEALAHPGTALIFSDEDTIDSKGARTRPWFKQDWNQALMLSHNAVGHLAAYSSRLVDQVGGFRDSFPSAEEHDLALRCVRAVGPNRVRHVARVLCHRQRGLAMNYDGCAQAISAHLAAEGIVATLSRIGHSHKVNYAPVRPAPRVSVIVATTALPSIARSCFASLAERTDYLDFEVIVLVSDKDLRAPERAAFLADVGRDSRVRVVSYEADRFNYSRVNNYGAAAASGSVLCFLNDDTEAIKADWLDQLVARVMLPGVAATGPMLYYPDGTIQHAGVILGLSGVAGHACAHAPRGSAGYFGRACLEQDVSCVTAACMLVRSDVFHEVGGFDEELPLAYNDVDLCLRMRAGGHRIVWTPSVELIHHESISLGRHDSARHAVQFARDIQIMRERWDSVLKEDPFYNPNLSLVRGYELAFPPRRTANTNGQKK